jgi:hypothetical protein
MLRKERAMHRILEQLRRLLGLQPAPIPVPIPAAGARKRPQR